MPLDELREALANAAAASSAPGEPVPVSNPTADFLFSISTGFIQSETDTAWCGNNVVVGFNDSGSLLESMLFGPGGSSDSGVGYSTDQGASFRDAGFVNPGPNPKNLLIGDPVVGCASGSNFHFSQLFSTTDPTGKPLTAVSLSTSTDGGGNVG
jgi:hypothetical protein